MNILYLCDEYPPGRHGGIGTAVQLLARQMVKQGHNVVVAGLYTFGYGYKDKFDDEGIKVHRFRMGWDSKWFNNQQSLPVRIITGLLKSTGVMEADIKRSLASYHKRLEKIIVEYQIDIVEMPDYNDYIRFCKSAIPFSKLSVPVIVKLHGSLTYFNNEANKQTPQQVFEMEKHIIMQATTVTSVSQYAATKSAACFSYPGEIKVLYNGINTATSVSQTIKQQRQVIFSGTLVQKKGIYQLAKAWNLVNDKMPDAKLLVFGKGPSKKVMTYLSKDAKHSVVFMGHVPTDTLYSYLSSSMVSVFPSYSESFGLAVIEAMACGTAVINSNRTSGPELVNDNETGLLIDPDDVNQLANAILHLLNNPEVCAQLVEKATKIVKEKFEISELAKQNLKFYKDVLRQMNK